jgi:hypothetical protein
MCCERTYRSPFTRDLKVKHIAIGGLMSNAGDIRAKERRSWINSGELLELVRAKRAEVENYLNQASRRRRLLTNLVLTGSAVAAVLTAPPAVGGKPFANWLQGVFGAKTPSWQYLCIFATLFSAATLIATQLQKSNNYDENIARARAVRATLETLEVSVSAGSMTTRDGTQEFLRCLENSSFIDPPRHPGTPAT